MAWLADWSVHHLRGCLALANRPLAALPPFDMPHVVERGRCVYDGYQRGAPPFHVRLAEDIRTDPLFRKALSVTRDIPLVRIMVTERRLMNLFFVVKFFLGDLISQYIVKFGSYRGVSALFMAMLLRELYPEAGVYALDTCAGTPAGEAALDRPPRDDFAATDLAAIPATAASLGLANVEFVKGLTQDTAEDISARAGTFGFAHIDLVFHSAIVYAQDPVWSRMTPGGYVVYNDVIEPICPGTVQAAAELIRERDPSLEQLWPHGVLHGVLHAPLADSMGHA